MPIGDLRRKLTLLLAACAAVILLSYGFAGYLLHKRNRPAPSSEKKLPETEEQVARADRLLKAGKVEQALLAYREALARDPQSLAAQLGLAAGELRAGREEVAALEYERAVRLRSDNRESLLQLALIYSRQPKNWAAAEARYRSYLQLDPADARARLGLARVLAWQGKVGEAADIFARPEVAPLMTRADQRDRAFALLRLERLEQAEGLLKSLLATGPGDKQLLLQLAGIYARRRDWESALPIYRAALDQNAGDPHVNLMYGLGLLTMKHYRAAAGPLSLARRRMPSDAEAGLAYARAVKGSGDLKAADREYERVMPFFQADAPVIREYADALLEKRSYRKSARYYEAAYRIGLRDEALLLGLAGALAGDRQYRKALPHLEEAYRRHPTERVAFELAKVLQKLGQNQRALRLLQQVESRSRARGDT